MAPVLTVDEERRMDGRRIERGGERGPGEGVWIGTESLRDVRDLLGAGERSTSMAIRRAIEGVSVEDRSRQRGMNSA